MYSPLSNPGNGILRYIRTEEFAARTMCIKCYATEGVTVIFADITLSAGMSLIKNE